MTEPKSEEEKFISYLGMGINTLVIGVLTFIGQMVYSTSLTVARFEENIKTLSKQYEVIESKLDRKITEIQETEKKVSQIESHFNRLK